jgi:hypothetical protein
MSKQVRDTLLLSYAMRLHFHPNMRKDPAGDGQADLIRRVFCFAYDVPQKPLRLHTSSAILGGADIFD